LTFLAPKDQTPVAIAEILPNLRISHSNFLEVFYCCCVILVLGAKKRKGGGYYLIKAPQEINMACIPYS
jgi:DNA-binding IscR family transcriptional regulator